MADLFHQMFVYMRFTSNHSIHFVQTGTSCCTENYFTEAGNFSALLIKQKCCDNSSSHRHTVQVHAYPLSVPAEQTAAKSTAY